MENQHQKYESRQLKGKIAVIFGAGGATGSQIAREFSKEEMFNVNPNAIIFHGLTKPESLSVNATSRRLYCYR